MATFTAFGGGYVTKFSGTTGAKISAARFSDRSFSGSCIAYESVSDRLVVGTWNEFGPWKGTAANVPGKGLWNINPSTMAVVPSGHFGQIPISVLDLTDTADGVWALVSTGGLVYMLVKSTNVTGTTLASFNPSTNSFVAADGATYGSLEVPGALAVNSNGLVLISYVNEMTVWNLPTPIANTPIFDVTYGVGIIPAGTPGLSRIATDGTGHVYAVDQSADVIKTAADLTGAARLSVGDATARYFGIAYNSVDGFVYLANPTTNTVAIWNTSTDTLVAIKTGFDTPIGFCFTPNKKWAVQQGAVGLKEII